MSSVLLLAALAALQTTPAPGSSATDLTRMLNGAPPATARPTNPAVAQPATAPAAARPTAVPATVAPSSAAGRPIADRPAATVPAAPARTAPAATRPAAVPPPASSAPVAPTRAPAAAASAPAERPAVAVTPAPPVATPPAASAPATSPAEPPPPPPTVLDAAAIAALPFAIELPAGLSVTSGRPGPNFNIWTVRRGERSLVMIYAGPTSQFPIYSGEMVEAGGRASIVTNEEGRRVALEHLFTRNAAPQEIHVWITSVEGEDRLLAERVGQSVDAK